MKVGFTGTRVGLTNKQLGEVAVLLAYLEDNNAKHNEFHYGGCIGADEQAATLAEACNFKLHCHPAIIGDSLKSKKRFTNQLIYRARSPLVRNADIVEACQFLIACPKNSEEVQRSGTWATIRYARSLGKTTIMVYP